MDPLLDPPLNMMSFMISVKFRLIGDTQILSGSSGIIGLLIDNFKSLIVCVKTYIDSFISPRKKKWYRG